MGSQEQDDLYALLGLKKGASQEEIRRAYHEAALRLHPDVNIEPGQTELFLRVQEAYEVLSHLPTPPPAAASAPAGAPAPAPAQPLFVADVTYSRSVVPPIEEPQLVYVLLTIRPGQDLKPMPPPPLNLCLVLDRSTSMQGVRMDTLKSAAVELLRQLRPEDTISVIAFSDRAEVLVPASRSPDRQTVETMIRMLQAGGGTEIYKGLESGVQEIRRSLSPACVNHIILLTDGATYGDEARCLSLADAVATQGVGITCMGIGSEWNDAFLDSLASRTGGNSMYISRPAAIGQFLQEKLDALSKTFAEQVTLQFQLAPDVSINYAFRLHPNISPLNPTSPLLLGSLPRDSHLSLLMEFVLPPLPAYTQNVDLGAGLLQMNIVSQGGKTPPLKFSFKRPVNPDAKAEPPPRPIFQAMQQITLYRMQEQARQEVAEGNILGASRRLQHLATHLLSQGERDLAHTVLMEAERIQQTHALSGEGEKRIKYGTRSLLLPANVPEG